MKIVDVRRIRQSRAIITIGQKDIGLDLGVFLLGTSCASFAGLISVAK
jgi:hypothetical protein